MSVIITNGLDPRPQQPDYRDNRPPRLKVLSALRWFAGGYICCLAMLFVIVLTNPSKPPTEVGAYREYPAPPQPNLPPEPNLRKQIRIGEPYFHKAEDEPKSPPQPNLPPEPNIPAPRQTPLINDLPTPPTLPPD